MNSKKKVLIIDPNVHTRKITEGYLRTSSYWQTKIATTLDQAFTDICFWEPQIVICSEKLSDGTIFDLLAKCQQAGNSLPPFGMIACLAQPSKATVLSARRLGRPLVLRTPFSRSELESRMAYIATRLSENKTLMVYDEEPGDASENDGTSDLLSMTDLPRARME